MIFTIEDFFKYSTTDLTTVLDTRDSNPEETAETHIKLVCRKIDNCITANSLIKFKYDSLTEEQKEEYKYICMDYMMHALENGYSDIPHELVSRLISGGLIRRRDYGNRFI